MKKSILILITAITLPLNLNVAFAAPSGFGGDPNSGYLYWYCESLGVIVPPPATPMRESFCLADSPDEVLTQLQFRINIQGASNIPPACNTLAPYNLTSPLVGYNFLAQTSPETIKAGYTYDLIGSWREDVLVGTGTWALLIAPALPGIGGATQSTGTYGNVVAGTAGNCF